ncbi:hypothetical protein ACHAPU_002191 [Fusarium lateritium]
MTPHAAAARELSTASALSESRRLGSRDGVYSDGSGNGLEGIATQNVGVEGPESWKYPRENVFKTGAVFWSLLTSGANDAAYGVLYSKVLWNS